MNFHIFNIFEGLAQNILSLPLQHGLHHCFNLEADQPFKILDILYLHFLKCRKESKNLKCSTVYLCLFTHKYKHWFPEIKSDGTSWKLSYGLKDSQI